MSLTLTLIRSGLTREGENEEYTGLQDEPLGERGITELSMRVEQEQYPEVARVYTSDVYRARQTANRIYPGIPAIVERRFQPFDYGDYTGKSYQGLCDDNTFCDWAGKSMMEPCPDGESLYSFIGRCLGGFQFVIEEMEGSQSKSAAIVTHRSVILTLIKRFCVPRLYYSEQWDLLHGGGLTIDYNSRLKSAGIKNSF